MNSPTTAPTTSQGPFGTATQTTATAIGTAEKPMLSAVERTRAARGRMTTSAVLVSSGVARAVVAPTAGLLVPGLRRIARRSAPGDGARCASDDGAGHDSWSARDGVCAVRWCRARPGPSGVLGPVSIGEERGAGQAGYRFPEGPQETGCGPVRSLGDQRWTGLPAGGDQNDGTPAAGAAGVLFRSCGGWGIRTPEGLHPTRFPSVRHRPLGESSEPSPRGDDTPWYRSARVLTTTCAGPGVHGCSGGPSTCEVYPGEGVDPHLHHVSRRTHREEHRRTRRARDARPHRRTRRRLPTGRAVGRRARLRPRAPAPAHRRRDPVRRRGGGDLRRRARGPGRGPRDDHHPLRPGGATLRRGGRPGLRLHRRRQPDGALLQRQGRGEPRRARAAGARRTGLGRARAPDRGRHGAGRRRHHE